MIAWRRWLVPRPLKSAPAELSLTDVTPRKIDLDQFLKADQRQSMPAACQARPGRGGRLNEAQAAMREHLVGCGFDYLCTDDIEAAICWLKARGVLRSGIIHVQ
jgi:hypothetical protein